VSMVMVLAVDMDVVGGLLEVSIECVGLLSVTSPLLLPSRLLLGDV